MAMTPNWRFQNLGDVGSRFRASLKVALGTVPRDRPLIFVAHSLGGLVLKQAMVQMFTGDTADFRNFKATFGILFFGVPNQGMDISSLLAMVDGQPNLHFLSTSSKDGGFLQGLIENFRAMFNYPDSRVYSFYETNMSPTAQEGEPGKWSMTGRYAVLVDRHSARSGRSWEGENFHLPISRNHSEMVKFSQYSEDCSIICDILRQLGEDARTVISRRWWWWERESSTKIGFGGNPIFKMLFSDGSAPPPAPSSESIGPRVLPKALQSAGTESALRPRISPTSKSPLVGSENAPIIQNRVENASNMRLKVPPQVQGSKNDPPNAISEESSNEESSQQARVNLNKTVGGFTRNWGGYEHVGVLFLTWETETQRRLIDVETLRDLLTTKFNFEVHGFKIPPKKCQTSFAKAVADFTYAYDSPSSLVIVYYGGHGYLRNELGLEELRGKFKEDVVVDGMLEDLRTCLRLPNCDVLLIINYCNATRIFDAIRRQPMGKQKIEILTSGTIKAENNAPSAPGWFTKILNEALSKLLKDNPRGFPSSKVCHEIYRATPNTKPQLSDLSYGNHNKVWLCPRIPSREPAEAETKGELFLNLKLRLTGQQIEISMMNDIAVHLQNLPHVEEIKFENLSAPSREIADFMQFIMRAQKLRPLLKKLHARRQFRQVEELSRNSGRGSVAQDYSHRRSEDSVPLAIKKRRLNH